MGLKETLRAIAVDVEYKKYCKFGAIFMGLDEETQDLLAVACKGNASTLEITRALNADGIEVRREHVGEKRRCFMETNPNCCLERNRTNKEESK